MTAIYRTSLLKPNFENPDLIVPNTSDEVINGLSNIKDGFLFSSTKNGVEAKLYLYKKTHVEQLVLPFPAGDISIGTQSSRSNNFWITCSGWKNDSERFKYNYALKKFTSENLSPIIDYPEFKDIIVEETVVKSHDGVDIPLSLIYKKGINKII